MLDNTVSSAWHLVHEYTYRTRQEESPRFAKTFGFAEPYKQALFHSTKPTATLAQRLQNVQEIYLTTRLISKPENLDYNTARCTAVPSASTMFQAVCTSKFHILHNTVLHACVCRLVDTLQMTLQIDQPISEL